MGNLMDPELIFMWNLLIVLFVGYVVYSVLKSPAGAIPSTQPVSTLW